MNLEIPNEYFDAAATLECGQVFRFWREDDGYVVISRDKHCRLRIHDNFTTITTAHADYFFNYFDLGRDYGEVAQRLKEFPELCEGLERANRGIHILRQDPFETVISFIISQNNNIPRIKKIIEGLCAAFGKKTDGYSAFPTPEDLARATVDDFRGLGAGYRAEYLFAASLALLDGSFLDNLNGKSYECAVKALMGLRGVGRKVADCISLFGLNHMGCYPVDTWILKADKEFGNTPESVAKMGMERYGAFAGLAQQYKFYNVRQ